MDGFRNREAKRLNCYISISWLYEKRIEKSNFEVYNIFKAESLQGVMKGGSFMLTLQEQVVQKVNRLSEN